MQWRRVLVTGGTGFIGTHFVDALVKQGYEVHLVGRERPGRTDVSWHECDLVQGVLPPAELEHVDHVFHLASVRGNVAVHRAQADEILDANLRLTSSLVAAYARSSVHPPLTFFSSATVPSEILPTAEFDGYAIGKYLSEQLLRAASAQFRFPVLMLRPVNVYGPGDRFSVDGNVIPALIVKASQAPEHLQVWGSGNQRRSFVYVEDVVRAALLLSEAQATGTWFIQEPSSILIRDLASLIRDLTRPGLPLAFDTSCPEGPLELETQACHPLLHEMTWTPLAEGLRKTVEDFSSNTSS